MDHLPWYSQASVNPVRVPFIGDDGPLCGADEFLDFPKKQGWELGESTSLTQLAERAQAWLFFGLLAVAGISPEECIASGVPGTSDAMIDTSGLLFRLRATITRDFDRSVSLRIAESLGKTEEVMREDIIPLIKDFERTESLTLWNSEPYAVLFSIEILMDSIGCVCNGMRALPQRAESLFPSGTAGIAESLRQVGRCSSLAHRLDLRSADFYLLMSLPNGANNEDHSQCNPNSCTCLDVDPVAYQPRHAEECVLCADIRVVEEELINIIQKDEVPLIRSTMDSEGNITLSVVQMSIDVEYTALSHVSAGGLRNSEGNWLSDCQLKAIHQDVCSIVEVVPGNARAVKSAIVPRRSQKLKKRRWLRSRTTSVCHYWLDSLCVPVSHPEERGRVIKSMGRIYAGAVNVLVVDLALGRIHYNALGDQRERDARANLLISASPWMARSWPHQEAALAPSIYVKFADALAVYRHPHFSIAADLPSISNQYENEDRFSWYGALKLDFGLSVDNSDGQVYISDTFFANLWKLLAERAVSCPQDAPEIFAAPQPNNTRQCLAIVSDRQAGALLRSSTCEPLESLFVMTDLLEGRGMRHVLHWVPKSRDSKAVELVLDARWGILQGVPGGLSIRLNPTEPVATRAKICQSGIVPFSSSVLRDVDSQEAFQIHIDPATSPSVDNTSLTTDQARLLLLLSRPHPTVPSNNIGLIFTVFAENEKSLRVRRESTFSWAPETDVPPNSVPADCSSVDESYEIVIETDPAHRPVFTWSRFTPCPYHHLQSRRIATSRIQNFYVLCSTLLPILVASLGALVIIIDSHLASPRVPEEWQKLALPCLIGSAISVVPVCYLASRDARIAGRAMARRARYTWALNFWDVNRTKKDQASVRGFISLDLVLRTLIGTLISALVLTIGIRSRAPKTVLFFGMLPGVVQNILRILFLAFLQAQCFCSTFEGRSRRVQKVRMVHELLTVMLKYVHMDWVVFVALPTTIAGFLAVFASHRLWLIMSLQPANVPHTFLVAAAVIVANIVRILFWAGVACGCSAFVAYQIKLLVGYLVKRVRLAYPSGKAIRLP